MFHLRIFQAVRRFAEQVDLRFTHGDHGASFRASCELELTKMTLLIMPAAFLNQLFITASTYDQETGRTDNPFQWSPGDPRSLFFFLYLLFMLIERNVRLCLDSVMLEAVIDLGL